LFPLSPRRNPSPQNGRGPLKSSSVLLPQPD
jgi:hypothetical protein